MATASNNFSGYRRSLRLETLEARWLLAGLTITEVMFNPTAGDNKYVEVYNDDVAPIDLLDWKISGGIDFQFEGTTLAAGEILTVVPFNPDSPVNAQKVVDFWNAYYPKDKPDAQLTGGYAGDLIPNEVIRLQKPDGSVADESPILSTSAGTSLHRVCPDTNSWTSDAPNPGIVSFVCGNSTPVIISSPVTTATEDLLYSYDVDAVDPDVSDILTYSLDVSPSGMTIDSVTGLIEWTPGDADVGDHPVEVRVDDLAGLFDTQSYVLTVAGVNDAPVIISSPVTTATEDLLYSYDVDAVDPDVSDILTYSLDVSPSGMTIDSVTGLIEWTPGDADVGDHPVEVRVDDLAGLFDTQSYVLTVAGVNDAPVIISSPVATTTEDLLYSYDVDAVDPDVGDILTYSLDVSPSGMTIDSVTGLIEWTPGDADVGDHPVEVRVDDLAGLFDTQSYVLTVAGVNDAPVNTVPGSQEAKEDIPLEITGISVADVDVDEGAGDVQVTLSVGNGTLSLSSTTGVTVDKDGSDGIMVFSGPILDVNSALAIVTYQGDADFNGADTLTITTNDRGNTGLDPGLTGDANSEEDKDIVAITVLSPEDQIDDLITAVGDLVPPLNDRQAKSLIKKLLHAQRECSAGDYTTCVNVIDAFVHQVEAFGRAGFLTTVEVDLLRSAALDVILSSL